MPGAVNSTCHEPKGDTKSGVCRELRHGVFCIYLRWTGYQDREYRRETIRRRRFETDGIMRLDAIYLGPREHKSGARSVMIQTDGELW